MILGKTWQEVFCWVSSRRVAFLFRNPPMPPGCAFPAQTSPEPTTCSQSSEICRASSLRSELTGCGSFRGAWRTGRRAAEAPVWLLVGFLLLVPFFPRRTSIILFLLAIGAVAVPQPNTLWSAYCRIEFVPLPSPPGSNQIAANSVVTNHVWYQWLADLSPAFLQQYPNAEPNRFLAPYYDLPYRLVPHPRNVLISGAGTGNDVAAALRPGAEPIDAVELDAVILWLGRQLHPEGPHQSPKVTAHVDDARAFLKKTDLIVFACLDSTTLLSGFSSLRLDNYVYTVESFSKCEARSVSRRLVSAFFRHGPQLCHRSPLRLHGQGIRSRPGGLFHTPLGKWPGPNCVISELPNANRELQSKENVILATDHWPFLYLQSRSVPGSILVVSALFLVAAWLLLRKLARLRGTTNRFSRHFFFFLGAGFLLLETKAVTQMSLFVRQHLDC